MNKGLEIRRPPKKAFLGVFYVLALALFLLLVLHKNPLADQHTEMLKKICGSLLIAMSCIGVSFGYDKLTVLPGELFQNRKLIKKLAINDFKKRYAGSNWGIIWALVQPIVTVILYYIVFGVIFKGGRTEELAEAQAAMEVPQVLFLTAGLVPWFFFMEGLTNGTTSLLEYNYLVKKVLFKISILPVIKVIAAMFIHVFFILLLFVVAVINGYGPSIYWIQIIYYMGCEFILILSLSFLTCSVAVFLRDIIHFIGIFMQVLQWATPILWNIEMLPDKYRWIVKLIPVTYIVEGYRNSIYGETWFFEHFYSSTYFWICVVILFCIGTLVFKRTKPHFADVL